VNNEPTLIKFNGVKIDGAATTTNLYLHFTPTGSIQKHHFFLNLNWFKFSVNNVLWRIFRPGGSSKLFMGFSKFLNA